MGSYLAGQRGKCAETSVRQRVRACFGRFKQGPQLQLFLRLESITRKVPVQPLNTLKIGLQFRGSSSEMH